MTFDLIVTITLHFMRGAKQRESLNLQILEEGRFLILGLSVRLSISSNLSLLNAY